MGLVITQTILSTMALVLYFIFVFKQEINKRIFYYKRKNLKEPNFLYKYFWIYFIDCIAFNGIGSPFIWILLSSPSGEWSKLLVSSVALFVFFNLLECTR
jgi:hypothetical protein